MTGLTDLDRYHADQARLERTRLHYLDGEARLCRATGGRATSDAREMGGKRACVSCRQLLEQRQRERAAAPFAASGPAPVQRGTSELGEREAETLARSVAGEAYERAYAWRSVELAVSTLVAFRHEGAPMRSTSSPQRFDPDRVHGAGEHGRAVSALPDRLLGVDRAVRLAFVRAMSFAASTAEDGTARPAAIVPVAAQRVALLLSIAGGRTATGTRNFSALPTSRVAELLESEHGLALTDRQVTIVVREGKRRVAASLRATGELAPAPAATREASEQEGRPMAVIMGCDVHGWEAIGEAVGLAESTCQRLSEREVDPLPIYRLRDVRGVGAKRDELIAWARRQVVSNRGQQ